MRHAVLSTQKILEILSLSDSISRCSEIGSASRASLIMSLLTTGLAKINLAHRR